MRDKKIIAWQNLQISALNTVAEDYSKYIRKLEKENAELKEKLASAERTRDNLKQIGFPTFQSCKEYADTLNYAKTIIKDLLDNSDEYARQRAIDFLKEGENDR
jgi:hypothetical protein